MRSSAMSSRASWWTVADFSDMLTRDQEAVGSCHRVSAWEWRDE
jgi:hypothetical protein